MTTTDDSSDQTPPARPFRRLPRPARLDRIARRHGASPDAPDGSRAEPVDETLSATLRAAWSVARAATLAATLRAEQTTERRLDNLDDLRALWKNGELPTSAEESAERLDTMHVDRSTERQNPQRQAPTSGRRGHAMEAVGLVGGLFGLFNAMS